MLEEEQKTVETTETTVTTDNKPQKKYHKKAIVITSVVAAGAVAVGAGVPAILSMKKGAEQQYLKENPTKYLAHSVTNYFNEQEKNNGAYNFAKNIYKTGGIKFNYNAQGTEVSAVAGYDSQNRQVYIDASGKMTIMGSEQNAALKSYLDKESFNVDYDFLGSKGSYFVDLKNLKSDFEGSVFNDKNSSLYNEQFAQMIDKFEKSYELSQDDQQMKNDFDETISKICKSFETNGHVEVTNQKVNIEQKEYSADVITYDFKSQDITNLLNECKNYFVEYMTKYKDTMIQSYEYFSIGDLEKQIEKSISDTTGSFAQDIDIKIEFLISTETQQMLKALYTQTESGNKGTISLSFPPNSETVFDLNVSSTGDKYYDTYFDYALSKKDENDSVIYKFTANSKDNPEYSLTFDYNKNDSKLKITNLTDPSAQPAELTPSEFISRISSATANDFTVTFNFECTDDKISIGDETWNLELSATPNITPFKAEKNIFKLTEEEIQSAFPGMIGNNYSVITTDSDYITKASMIDSACKKLYAMTVAGSINSETAQEELSDLDASKLPKPTATTAEKREIANNLTVKDALDYGYDNFTDAVMNMEYEYQYGYSLTDGTIIYYGDDSIQDLTQYVFLDLENTTLGDLYNH